MDTVTSSGGVVFSNNDNAECSHCHAIITESYEALYCPKCGNTTLLLPKNLNDENYISISQLVQDFANRSALLLKPGINDYILSIQSTIRPWSPNSIFSPNDTLQLEKSLCNSAILKGFVLRLIEEIYFKPQSFKFPKDLEAKTEHRLLQAPFLKGIYKNWEESYKEDAVLEINLLTYYLFFKGVSKYIYLREETIGQVVNLLGVEDAEFQNMQLKYKYMSSQEDKSGIMIVTGYALGIAFSFNHSSNGYSSTSSFYTEALKSIIKESKVIINESKKIKEAR